MSVKQTLFQITSEGGNAVYRARAFWAVLTKEYVSFNDSLLCASVQALAMPITHFGISAHLEESDLRIFPNPASNEIRLVWSKQDESPGLVQVSDIYGRPIRQFVIAASTSEQAIQLTGLPDGVYVFRIRLNGKDTVRKVIVQR